MRRFALFVPLTVLAACSSSAPSETAPDATSDAQTETTTDVSAPCNAALSEEASFDDPPKAAWCAKGNGLGGKRSTKACDGYLAILIGEGVDCMTLYLFDETTKKLAGELHGCNLMTVCVAGPASFRTPSPACVDENGFAWGDAPVCASRDGGAAAFGDSGSADGSSD
jgi:hypothetical protein